MYAELALHVAGEWIERTDLGEDVLNPADESVVGQLPHADHGLLDRALASAEHGFGVWRNTPVAERAGVLHETATLLARRRDEIARVMTIEQGKPLLESGLEMDRVVETFRWFADEATRVTERRFPSKPQGFRQCIAPEPVGVVAAFTAWNFPGILPARKLAPALAAGCSVILKASEETPGTAVALVRALRDAGLPGDVINLVFGVPSEVSNHLLKSPTVRKLSFTGSVPVGKVLAAQAAKGLKRCTFELGGHAPTIVCADADVEGAIQQTAGFKYRNAGQVCIAPSRFFVQTPVYDRFLAGFAEVAQGLEVGAGLEDGVDMGPMANDRRIMAMERFVEDARKRGASVETGGERVGNRGFFFAPTVLGGVPDEAAIMSEEPFGPVAPVVSFDDVEEAIARANALPYGLAAYAFTGSETIANHLAQRLEAGGVALNCMTPMLAETPFGGVKESGYGYEGGREGLDAYYHNKLVSRCVA